MAVGPRREVAMNRRRLVSVLLTTGCWLVALLLMGLRLDGAIAWSWAWILSPLWLPFVLRTIAIACLAIILWRIDPVA
jgi:hypothetical protein